MQETYFRKKFFSSNMYQFSQGKKNQKNQVQLQIVAFF